MGALMVTGVPDSLRTKYERVMRKLEDMREWLPDINSNILDNNFDLAEAALDEVEKIMRRRK